MTMDLLPKLTQLYEDKDQKHLESCWKCNDWLSNHHLLELEEKLQKLSIHYSSRPCHTQPKLSFRMFLGQKMKWQEN
jgi:hypothetical protein